ncbi:MAG: hypothetical protein JW874_05905 [Spirochaetales bacterium]|nr:hypothetical protein [Spirochaetales bacterium]
MGYHSISLSISVDELHGDNEVYWGMKWIDQNYGQHLRTHEYKHAFHIHNTGRKYPVIGDARTTNPDYVDYGIRLMAYFE